MKLFLILSCLCGFLQANVVTRHLDVLEGEANYRQTVTIDYDKNIQIVEVPAHNFIVHSKTIFDFNKGKLFESHPEDKKCFVRAIPEGTADLKTFDAILESKTDKLIASNEKRVQTAFKTARKWNVKMLKSMTSEVIEECGESEIYEVVEVPVDTARKTLQKPAKKDSAYKQMMTKLKTSEDECQNIKDCLWQTCTYGTDSCYWIVNCPPTPSGSTGKGCDIYHSSVLHADDVQITCKACFNLQCGPQCKAAWENKPCHDTLIAAHMPACPDDPTYGAYCEDMTKPHCLLPDGVYASAVANGHFDCRTATEKGIVPLGGSCAYVCNDNQFGGTLTCAEKEVNGKMEGYFDEAWYTPENCQA